MLLVDLKMTTRRKRDYPAEGFYRNLEPGVCFKAEKVRPKSPRWDKSRKLVENDRTLRAL